MRLDRILPSVTDASHWLNHTPHPPTLPWRGRRSETEGFLPSLLSAASDLLSGARRSGGKWLCGGKAAGGSGAGAETMSQKQRGDRERLRRRVRLYLDQVRPVGLGVPAPPRTQAGGGGGAAYPAPPLPLHCSDPLALPLAVPSPFPRRSLSQRSPQLRRSLRAPFSCGAALPPVATLGASFSCGAAIPPTAALPPPRAIPPAVLPSPRAIPPAVLHSPRAIPPCSLILLRGAPSCDDPSMPPFPVAIPPAPSLPLFLHLDFVFPHS